MFLYNYHCIGMNYEFVTCQRASMTCLLKIESHSTICMTRYVVLSLVLVIVLSWNVNRKCMTDLCFSDSYC